MFRHDQRTGVTTNGKSTAATGQEIKFYGPKYEADWRVALPIILDKVGDAGTRLDSAGFDEPRLVAAMEAVPPTAARSSGRPSPLVPAVPTATLCPSERPARASRNCCASASVVVRPWALASGAVRGASWGAIDRPRSRAGARAVSMPRG